MRQAVTLFSILLLGTMVQAQITIERQDYTLEVGAQIKMWDVDFANASIPEEGEGVVWDFSDAALADSDLVDYEVPSSPLFPQANITNSSPVVLLGGLGVQPGTSYHLLDDDAYGNWGLIGEKTDLPLALVTGGATDTLTALELIIEYEQRKSPIQFPLNYGDSWIHNGPYTADFLITVAAFGLQGVPAQQITQDSSNYVVAGYGEIVLPNPEGAELEPVRIEALMVKRDRVVTRNYTLGGQPAPQVMLDAFGLEQGQSQLSTRYFFYGKGLPRSAANIEVNSDGEITSISVPDDIKNLISSTSKVAVEPVRAKAFPNPAVAGTQLSVEMPSAIDNGVLELLDAHGRQAAVWPVSALQGQIVQRNLPENLQVGMYVYRIVENNQEVRGIGKLNIVR